MKHLYEAWDNAANYLVVRDMDRDENDTAVVNWDLSEKEIEDAVKAFEEDEDDDSFYANPGEDLNFRPFEEIMDSMNGFKAL